MPAMKNLNASIAFISLALLPFSALPAAPAPSGLLVELNSTQVFTGGCTASAEHGSHGRSVLRFWNITGGAHQGVDLTGLHVAALQTGDQHLPSRSGRPTATVLYLPAAASPAAQAALESWVQEQLAGQLGAIVARREVDFRFASAGVNLDLAIGSFARLATFALDDCEENACGQSLQYTPLTPNTGFTVARNLASNVEEPALRLTWCDFGLPSVFLATFGDRRDLLELCSVATLSAE